jgi:hypothetical protein
VAAAGLCTSAYITAAVSSLTCIVRLNEGLFQLKELPAVTTLRLERGTGGH